MAQLEKNLTVVLWYGIVEFNVPLNAV